MNPRLRTTAHAALTSPFVLEWHDAEDEPLENNRFEPLVQLEKKTADEIVEMIYDLAEGFSGMGTPATPARPVPFTHTSSSASTPEDDPIAEDVAELVLVDEVPSLPSQPATMASPHLLRESELGALAPQRSLDSLEGCLPSSKVLARSTSTVEGGAQMEVSTPSGAEPVSISRTTSAHRRPETPLEVPLNPVTSDGMMGLIEDLEVEVLGPLEIADLTGAQENSC